MAFTVSAYAKTVHGNQNSWQGKITADAVSGVVSFGYATLTQVQWSPASATTNGSGSAPRFRINATAAGSASAGDLGVSGVVSGDEYYVTVYGR